MKQLTHVPSPVSSNGTMVGASLREVGLLSVEKIVGDDCSSAGKGPEANSKVASSAGLVGEGGGVTVW
jgi:hypothetical protein